MWMTADDGRLGWIPSLLRAELGSAGRDQKPALGASAGVGELIVER